MLNASVLFATLAVALVLFHPRVSGSKGWRATVTPLASIIGSGFLVIGPILESSFGFMAPLAMALLCTLAYLFGGAIRTNMRRLQNANTRSATENALETAASWTLVLAYAISVAYYLNLLGAFAVSLTPYRDTNTARLITSAALILIAYVGWTRGFAALENMEKFSVSLKLAIIAGLLLGLAIYFADQSTSGNLYLNAPEIGGFAGLALIFGLLVTVQGFETSRYLGEDYDAATRISSMRQAQWIATAIYMVYILLLSFSFEKGSIPFSETAIISLLHIVAPILPVLLVAAALAAQFSAAVADTAGSGGLLMELTRGRISATAGYVLLAAIGLALTWTANVFEIITIASRAFAAYYTLQAAIAAAGAWTTGRRAMAVAYGCLALLGVAIVVAGTTAKA